MMGGRAAEELVFNIATTGAASDIKQATDLVRKLVCDFGMTKELGPLSYGEKEEAVFLGRDISRHRDYSEKTAETIDTLMQSIIEEQYTRAISILTEHREEMDRLTKALLEYELLDREDIDQVILGKIIETPKKTRSLVRSVSDTAAADQSLPGETEEATFPENSPLPISDSEPGESSEQ